MSHLLRSIKEHEGLRLRAYQDTVGVWTIGYGQNLQVLEIDEALAEKWLNHKIDEAIRDAASLPEYAVMDEVRQDVLIELVYNMGLATVKKFVNTRRAMLEGRYDDAAAGMLQSKWARQVGKRADRLASQMKTGVRWND
jgi:lysozyme